MLTLQLPDFSMLGEQFLHYWRSLLNMSNHSLPVGDLPLQFNATLETFYSNLSTDDDFAPSAPALGTVPPDQDQLRWIARQAIRCALHLQLQLRAALPEPPPPPPPPPPLSLPLCLFSVT